VGAVDPNLPGGASKKSFAMTQGGKREDGIATGFLMRRYKNLLHQEKRKRKLLPRDEGKVSNARFNRWKGWKRKGTEKTV